MKEWTNAPSGSAAKRKAKPQTYKYSANLYFLEEAENAETEDTMQPGTSRRTTPIETLSEVNINSLIFIY